MLFPFVVRIVSCFKTAKDFENEIQAAAGELASQGYVVVVQITQPTIISIHPLSKEYLGCVTGTLPKH